MTTEPRNLPSRRQALLSGLFGTGYIGLRALATGLPAAFLLNPRQALAEGCVSRETAQYLIWATSGSGDPANANVPGTYDDPGIAHSVDPQMAKTEVTLGGKKTFAAKPWAELPVATLARTSFLHHTTLTNSHANEGKVLKLMGGIKRQEMLVSLIAKHLAPCLGTAQREPASVSGEVISFGGRVLPALTPIGLRDVFISPKGPLTTLQQQRDADLDRIHAALREHGTTAQRAYLDRMALSKRELRNISDSVLNSLAGVTANNLDGQVTAAIALILMNVTPATVLQIPFGGDNHSDPNLARETTQHLSGIAAISSIQQKLAAAGMRDRVTFVMMNVFGRSLNRPALMGRDHLGSHHCTVLMGKQVASSVIGGVVRSGNDYAATAIDSRTGQSGGSADIPYAETLGAVGKTIASAVGLPSEIVHDQITLGKVISAALVK